MASEQAGVAYAEFFSIVLRELNITCCSQNIRWVSVRVLSYASWNSALCYVALYLHVCRLASFKIKGIVHTSFAAPLVQAFSSVCLVLLVFSFLIKRVFSPFLSLTRRPECSWVLHEHKEFMFLLAPEPGQV